MSKFQTDEKAHYTTYLYYSMRKILIKKLMLKLNLPINENHVGIIHMFIANTGMMYPFEHYIHYSEMDDLMDYRASQML